MRQKCLLTIWKHLGKLTIILVILSLPVFLILAPVHHPQDARLCLSEKTRYVCVFQSFINGKFFPPAPAIPSNFLERVESRVESRLQQRCENEQIEDVARFLSHTFQWGVGLGNFMFMAASTMGLAAASGRTAIFSDAFGHLKNFQHLFPMRNLTDVRQGAENSHLYTKIPLCGVFDGMLSGRLRDNSSATLVLTGYLQSWKFFIQLRDYIRCRFTFTKAVYASAVAALKTRLDLYSDDIQERYRLIGIHVRRGDIMTRDANNLGHIPASDAYLLHSITTLEQEYGGAALFIIISNDLPYCRSLLRNYTTMLFMDGNSAAVDLAILTLMDDLILTVGTYGWWGAFLSDARVVRYYDLWPRPGSAIAGEYRSEDYFLPYWIGAH